MSIIEKRLGSGFALAITISLCASLPVHAGERQFIDGQINDNDTVTLPLHAGRSDGKTVYYIVTDASDDELAEQFGAIEADRLENAHASGALQQGYFDATGVLHFDATVDFSPVRIVVPGPDGFPPVRAEPGAVGEPGYSPLVQLPDGRILNAPHIANASGVHDSASDVDVENGSVRIELVDGFARDKEVLYISTEASDPGAAALEASTFAPMLNNAPFVGGSDSDTARSPLAAITNGQTGLGNRNRQGLNSALMGEGDPLNLLGYLPNQGAYSPLWDVHLSTFADGERPRLQTRFADIEDLAEDGVVTAPDGSAWGPSNFIVNCPIVIRLD